ncbi:acyl-CoA dehydrogenase family protein [Paracoccus pantotrophus]|uniref:acyl-CoA dehydrogenase family protein n=1 Tax=Paracoccus pantotrophus TaxID=82367 RepID=UPI00048EE49B|nr:acyl-CoA dehydrogenase family protein [Paracoccus pantotrophus]
MIDFTIEPEFQEKLDWIRKFIDEEVEPLDVLTGYNSNASYDLTNQATVDIVKMLQEKVKAQGLWAPHLDRKLGGQGFGQAKLAFINEIVGRSNWGPRVFGAQAPDSGNSEILARFGSEEQKEKYLKPLLNGDIISCYSMTEPDQGSDPTTFKTTAVRDGDDWVINGEKWFSSNAKYAAFLITPVMTHPDAERHDRMTMFIVPTDTPGLRIIRNAGIWGESEEEASHGYVEYKNVRVPASCVLGEPGKGFQVAQSRLGGGRIHHAMRTVGLCQKALEMAMERAVSRKTRGQRLADLGVVQDQIGDWWAKLQMFRLLVLHCAWLYDQEREREAYIETAAVKVMTADISKEIIWGCAHLHGSLGASNEMRFGQMVSSAFRMAIVDGPTEAHRAVLGRQLLKRVEPAPGDGRWPSTHIPPMKEKAWEKYGAYFEKYA